MPDPTASHRDRKLPQAERAESTDKPTGPLFARAVHVFYDPIFDIRSRAAFQTALNEYVVLPPDERAFHETHLLFRLVQGLESIHGLLTRIEAKLAQIASSDLTALEHLEPIRAALEEIASNQPSLIQVDGWDGEDVGNQEEEEEEEQEDPDELADDEDPDFIYESVPDEEERPRRSRRAPTREAREPAPTEAPPRRPPLRVVEPPRPERAPDLEREALVGDLVPATEGPQGVGEGDR